MVNISKLFKNYLSLIFDESNLPPGPPRKDPVPAFAVWILIFFVGLGSFLRLYGLSLQSLNGDELFFLEFFKNCNNLTEFIRKATEDTNPPGYYLVLFFTSKLLRASEVGLRLPSAAAGIATIPVAFLLALKLYSWRTAVLFTCLMSMLWCPIYYSQEARVYSFLLLSSLLTYYFWFSTVFSLKYRSKASKFNYIGLITFSVFCSYMHHYGTLLVLSLGLIALVAFADDFVKLLKLISVYFAIFLAYTPWLGVLWVQATRNDAWRWLPRPGLDQIREFLGFLFNDISLVVIIFLAIVTVYFIFKVTKSKEASLLFDPDHLLLLSFFVPYLIAFSISYFFQPMLHNKYLLILLPPAYLLVSQSIASIKIPPKASIVIILLLSTVFLLNLIYYKQYYSRPTREQYREAAEFICSNLNKYSIGKKYQIIGNVTLFSIYFKMRDCPISIDGLVRLEDLKSLAAYCRKNSLDQIWYIYATWSSNAWTSGPSWNDVNSGFNIIIWKKYLKTGLILLQPKQK